MKPLVFVREAPGLNTGKVAQASREVVGQPRSGEVRRGCMVSGREENGWLCHGLGFQQPLL